MRIVMLLIVALASCAHPAEAEEAAAPDGPRVTLAFADAVARGLITFEARGAGTSAVALTLHARADVDVIIGAGTMFNAKANVQNMVVVDSATARLDRGASSTIRVATACASYHRAVPRSEHAFTLGTAEPRLHSLVTCLERRDVPRGRRQMLVWSVTDGVTPHEARQQRDTMRPFLVESCVEKLHRSHARCTTLVNAAYDLALDRWLETRDDDGAACLDAT